MSMNWPIQWFAHDEAVVMLWHVQIFGVMSYSEMSLQWNDIYIEIELMAKRDIGSCMYFIKLSCTVHGHDEWLPHHFVLSYIRNAIQISWSSNTCSLQDLHHHAIYNIIGRMRTYLRIILAAEANHTIPWHLWYQLNIIYLLVPRPK